MRPLVPESTSVREQPPGGGASSKSARQTVNDTPGRDRTQDEPALPRKVRTRPRGGRRRGPAKQPLETKDPQLVEMLTVMAKLVLQTEQRVRVLSSCIIHTVLIPQPHAVAKALEAEMRTYRSHTSALKDALSAATGDQEDMADDDATRARAALRDNGPPDPAMYAALAISLHSQDIGQKSRADMKALVDRLNDAPPSVELCRVDKTKEEKMVRLSLYAEDRSLTVPVIEACRALQFDVKRGPAQQGALSDQLGSWLDALQKK